MTGGGYAAAAFAAAVLAAPAEGQQPDHIGQWACQMTYTELDRFGNRTSGFVRDYMMAVHPNGVYEAAGTVAGAAGYHQFQSRGQWQAQGADMLAQGPEQSDAAYQAPGILFVFTGTLQADGTMSYRYEQPDPGMQYVMNRTLYYCERRG